MPGDPHHQVGARHHDALLDGGPVRCDRRDLRFERLAQGSEPRLHVRHQNTLRVRRHGKRPGAIARAQVLDPLAATGCRTPKCRWTRCSERKATSPPRSASTPCGSFPALSVATTLRVAASITETVSSRRLVTNARRPSGVNATPVGFAADRNLRDFRARRGIDHDHAIGRLARDVDLPAAGPQRHPHRGLVAWVLRNRRRLGGMRDLLHRLGEIETLAVAPGGSACKSRVSGFCRPAAIAERSSRMIASAM